MNEKSLINSMDWKDDIGTYFREKGIYRFKYLNQNLEEYLDEWKNYVGEFDGISIDIAHEYLEKNYKQYSSYWLKIRSKNYDSYRFQLNVSYCPSEESCEYCLCMKWTSHLSLGTKADILKNFRLEPDDEKNYKWEKEELFGAEICEKEFVFQLINNRVKNYFNKSLSIQPKQDYKD